MYTKNFSTNLFTWTSAPSFWTMCMCWGTAESKKKKFPAEIKGHALYRSYTCFIEFVLRHCHLLSGKVGQVFFETILECKIAEYLEKCLVFLRRGVWQIVLRVRGVPNVLNLPEFLPLPLLPMINDSSLKNNVPWMPNILLCQFMSK